LRLDLYSADMSEVEARELRYFVAVAEELNFSRAARRLGIAQPPLSKAISQLESRLGVKLLERTTRQVSLTAAGQALLDNGRAALEAVTAAVARAQRAGQPEPRLAVAVKPGSDGGLLREIIAAYQAPGLPPAHVLVGTWGQPETLLRDGRADVALLRSPFNPRGIEVEELLSEPRVAALPAGHRLARRTRLRHADLADEPPPQWPGADQTAAAYWTGQDPRSASATWPDAARLDPSAAGPLVNDLAQLLEVVALGQAIAFLPASTARRNPRTDLAYRPVADLSPSIVAVAWPGGCRSRAVAAFVAAAAQAATRDPDSAAALA
jgi:DNA-binding transcriptional LysR family regulator